MRENRWPACPKVFNELRACIGSIRYLRRLILGVFIGSALRWLVLSGSVNLLRTKLTPSGLRWVDRISGTIITGFGVIALLTLMP